METVAVSASGMVTSVGLDAPSSCAAIRCGLDNFIETRFMTRNGQWITGGEVPLDRPRRGRPKLVNMVASAVLECLESLEHVSAEKIPLLLCVAEQARPGRAEGLDDRLLDEVGDALNVRFHETSTVIPDGRVGGVAAIERAMALFRSGGLTHCIVAGVDSFLNAGTLSAMDGNDRILTETNSDGFIPGEAAAAALLRPERLPTGGSLAIHGVGFGKERAFMGSGEPLRAEGLVQAITMASRASGMTVADLDYRITDANGEQYGFKEAALAMTRTLEKRKEEFDIQHPVECIGEVGAAIVPVVLGVAGASAEKGYAPGKGALCHFSNDDERRAAMFLSISEGGGA